MRAGGAFGQFPFIAEQHVEIAVVPLRRVRRPRPLDPRGDGMAAPAAFVAADPAQALGGDILALGFGADQRRVARAVAFAKGVAARGQGHGFLVIHAHARECLADVAARGNRIGFAVRPFGIDVDQAHLHGGQRVFQHAVARIAAAGLVAGRQPFLFGAPVDVFLGFPDVLAAAAEAEDLAAHRFDGAIARQNQQVGPGQRVAVFLFHRPQQAPRLVQIGVVGPGIQRRETLRA